MLCNSVRGQRLGFPCFLDRWKLYFLQNLAEEVSLFFYSLLFSEVHMENAMVRRRPLGVSIISIILAIQGIFELLLGIFAVLAIFAAGHAISGSGHTTTGTVVDVLGGTLGGISLVIGILTLIFAIGLWTLKRWAFWLTVIIEFISLVRHALEFTHPTTSTVNILLGMVIPVVVLLYFLVDGNVRTAFFGRG